MYPEVTVITEDESTITTTPSQNYNALYCGHFERGPVNELTKVISVYDFKVTFGKPTQDNYQQWFEIYNYFEYGNKCIYIIRTDSKESKKAFYSDANNNYISAKNPGEWGNDLRVIFKNNSFKIYYKNELVETFSGEEYESHYIDFDLKSDELDCTLSGGIHTYDESKIDEAYTIAEDDDSVDFDFILANPAYEYPATRAAEKKNAIAFVNTPKNDNGYAICYQGNKKQESIFDGKTYSIPIIGDAFGLRTYLANNESLNESHCKRTYKLSNTISAEILKLRELYALNINGIAKDSSVGGYFVNSETMLNGHSLTTTLILNRLKKDCSNAVRVYIFEMNDEDTRSQLQKSLATLCENYKSSRYISDYKVVCDTSNQSTIEPNSIYADVIIKPIGIIENIKIRLKAVADM